MTALEKMPNEVGGRMQGRYRGYAAEAGESETPLAKLLRSLALAPALTLLLLAGCGDDAPDHYYVFCEDRDSSGWQLIDGEYDENGYLIACTYVSPDRRNAYTARCRKNGCD